MNVILDMDGTLIDSEGAIARASKAALVEWGVKCELPDFLEFTGRGDDRFIGGVSEKYGVAYTTAMKARAYEIYRENMHDWVEVYPWSRPLISQLKACGAKMAIASASDRIKVGYNIAALGFDVADFDAVITADDVSRQKPDPEIFVKAMATLGAISEETLVFEDTLAGVEAAKAAGAYCVAVTTSYKSHELIAHGADAVTDDLLKISKILEIFRR